MKYALMIVVSALALAGCKKEPDNANAPEAITATDAGATDAAGADSAADATLPRMTTQPSDARTYLDKAAGGDSFEIESSRALLKTSKNAEVRKFAHMMIVDHQQSTAKLRGIAQKLKLAPASPSLTSDQQQKLEAIKSADKNDVDQLYLSSQRSAHADALDLHRHYASDGDNAELKAAAAAIAPVVQKHLDELDRLGRPQAGA